MAEDPAPPQCQRRWISVSEPFNLDGPVSDEQAYHHRQSHLAASKAAVPHRPSPLVHAYSASRNAFTPLSSQEDAMFDYFPPVELMKQPASPTSGMHTLVVGNLEPSMTTDRLSSMFDTLQGFMPSFAGAKVMVHPQTRESLGYAIVYFEEERDQQ